MIRIIILVLVSSALINNAYSQIESLSPLDYEMIYKTEDRYFFKIDLYNPTENDIEFNWTLDYNFELTAGLSYFNTDLENEYFPGFLSICNSNVINILTPMDTMSIYVGFKTIDILPDVLADGPELNYYLQSPDCDTTYLHYNFKIVDRSVAIIDQLGGDFNLYPNPATDRIFLDMPNDEKGRILIYNNIGQSVLSKNIDNPQSTKSIDISSFPAGHYNMICIPSSQPKDGVLINRFVKVE